MNKTQLNQASLSQVPSLSKVVPIFVVLSLLSGAFTVGVYAGIIPVPSYAKWLGGIGTVLFAYLAYKAREKPIEPMIAFKDLPSSSAVKPMKPTSFPKPWRDGSGRLHMMLPRSSEYAGRWSSIVIWCDPMQNSGFDYGTLPSDWGYKKADGKTILIDPSGAPQVIF